MKKFISAVVFDFGNVLAKVDRLKMCAQLSIHSPLSPEEICRRIYGTDIEFDSETGKYDSREHFQRIKDRINGDNAWTYEQFCHEYRNGFTLNPEGVEALKVAADKKRVFILSNTTYLHTLWLFEQEILATLPELYTFSFKIGVMKPDPRIWKKMFRMGSVAPQECLYVDDVKIFCEAAERLGINTIHYQMGTTDLLKEISRWP